MRHRAAIALLIFVGCGNGSKTPVPNTLFADATLRPRAEAAPELLREAEEALSRAGHESDPEASADHLTEARLLFLAAVAEGERRLLLGAEVVPPTDPRAAPAGDALDRRRELAVALAAVEMETSIESARALEAGRWRSREASLTAARRDVLGAVVARTRVLLAALSVLGRAEAAEIAAFGRRLDEHGADRDPTAALDAVDRLRRELEARIARPRTTGAAIVGAAARAGVRVEPIDGLWVADLGVPDAADFGLAKAFLDAIAPQTVLLVIEGPPRASLAAALARAEASLVGAGVDPARIAALAVSDPSFREARLTLRVVGYPPP